jgi:hypothetical protein
MPLNRFPKPVFLFCCSEFRFPSLFRLVEAEPPPVRGAGWTGLRQETCWSCMRQEAARLHAARDTRGTFAINGGVVARPSEFKMPPGGTNACVTGRAEHRGGRQGGGESARAVAAPAFSRELRPPAASPKRRREGRRRGIVLCELVFFCFFSPTDHRFLASFRARQRSSLRSGDAAPSGASECRQSGRPGRRRCGARWPGC